MLWENIIYFFFCSFYDEFFVVYLNLKDGKGCVVSYGFLECNFINNDDCIYDRYVYVIIWGDIGYVVVYYLMFIYVL